ncbi:MAG: type II secretion system ATPase GspE [Thiotrichaceae bacterium]|nr:type II secretion system ATPase GspE [Thiotrichaceae bacterium]
MVPVAGEAAEHEAETVTVQRPSFSFAKRHGVMVGEVSLDHSRLICRDNVSAQALAETRRFLGVPLKIEALVEGEAFDTLIQKAYASDGSNSMQSMGDLGDELDLSSIAQAMPEPEDLLETQDDAPIIRLINALLTEAIKEGASDIHIETYESRMVVRFRVDGVLREVLEPARVIAPLLVSRVKVMAKLDIAEKRLPQDGRISLRVAGRSVDVRVSTLPSGHGERVVLRLLDKQAGSLDLDHLGMESRESEIMNGIIHKPHGIILVTGPTGSGKTTTLYAVLTRLNNKDRNIMTVEDPIEYYLDGVSQTQVQTKVDMSFSRGLRAILRQDPDVVMVGEIRDLETAEIAVQASLTGHLVLSTLHTNTAIGAVTRLRDMGVEPFLMASSLIGILAQRLVRKLCPDCKRPYQAGQKDCERLGVSFESPPTLYAPDGCKKCNFNGYRGRMGIFELVDVDEMTRTMIHDGAAEQQLEQHARGRTNSIFQDGIRRVLSGETSFEEVLRVTYEE